MHTELHRRTQEAMLIMLNRGLATRDERGKPQLTAEGRDILVGHGFDPNVETTWEVSLLRATGLLPAPESA
jgi:hypothetical protein